MLKVFSRHWRGGNGLWISALFCSLLGGSAAIFAGIQILSSVTPDAFPRVRMVIATLVSSAIAAAGIWQLVGTWRASKVSAAPQHFFISRWFARVAAVAVAAVALAIFAILPKTLTSLHEMATDQDKFGLLGNTVAVDDTRLVVTGYFSWGLLDRVDAALDANPGIETVVLNSPGGHTGVGRRLGATFGAHHLTTAVVDLCASACTFAFAGGEQRLAGPNARFGFHAENSDNPQSLKLSQALSKAFWEKFGMPPEFLQRVNDTPPESVFFADIDELRSFNLVTGTMGQGDSE